MRRRFPAFTVRIEMGRRRTYQVRVIAGELKGRRLRYPDDPLLRPTMQRTKSSIFESLGRRLRGAVFVDLYCGAGAMGIEALSRGARFAHFAEKSRTALDFLRRNLAGCRIDRDRYRIHAGDVMETLRSGVLTGADIVLADPPYDDTDFALLLALLAGIGYSGGGVIVLEHPSGLVADATMPLLRARKFGQTTVSFYEPGGE